MTAELALEIAGRHGHDVYILGVIGGVGVSYGMLRGWDEGYQVPSLGIAVRPDWYNRGIGRATIDALHRMALARGAVQVRLRVHPENARALNLYGSLGYRPVGVERGEILMVLRLGDAAPAGSPSI